MKGIITIFSLVLQYKQLRYNTYYPGRKFLLNSVSADINILSQRYIQYICIDICMFCVDIDFNLILFLSLPIISSPFSCWNVCACQYIGGHQLWFFLFLEKSQVRKRASTRMAVSVMDDGHRNDRNGPDLTFLFVRMLTTRYINWPQSDHYFSFCSYTHGIDEADSLMHSKNTHTRTYIYIYIYIYIYLSTSLNKQDVT